MAQRLGLIAALGFTALLACCSPAATTTSSTTTAATTTAVSAPTGDAAAATAIITALYQPYLKHTDASQPEPPDWEQALPMTPELAALVRKDREQAHGEVGAIDGDPIINAQDWQLSDLTVAPDAPFANGRGVVTAHFKNMGDATDVHFDMVQRASDHAWLVDNVRSTDSDLRALLAPPAHH